MQLCFMQHIKVTGKVIIIIVMNTLLIPLGRFMWTGTPHEAPGVLASASPPGTSDQELGEQGSKPPTQGFIDSL